MKKLKGIFIILIVLLSYSIFSEENLIKNGSFEENDGKLTFFWETNTWKNNADIVKFYLEKSNAYSGKYCFTIENLEEDDSKLLQNVRVKPNTYYKLSCMIKAEGIGVERLGANITVLNIFGSSNDYKDTNGKWNYAEVYGVTGSDQQDMTVSLRLGGYSNINTGKASFDDVKLVELEGKPDNINIINFYKEDVHVEEKVHEKNNDNKTKEENKNNFQNNVPIIVLIFLFFLLLFYLVYEYYIKRYIKGKSAEDEKGDDEKEED